MPSTSRAHIVGSVQTVFLAGPTATGKSAVAIELAQSLKAEILSADSMQVYRGMDIGTAKPSLAERAAVPHHLIDIIDPRQAYSAAQFAADDLRSVLGGCTGIEALVVMPMIAAQQGVVNSIDAMLAVIKE